MSEHPAHLGMSEEVAEMHPANRRADIDRVEGAVLSALERFHYPDASRFAVRLALEEALVNAFMHGHRGLPPEETVQVQYRIGPSEVIISVTDRGPGFNPDRVADPTSPDQVELPSGRGLMLIRAFMTDMHHESNGNRLVMTYRRAAPEAEAKQAG